MNPSLLNDSIFQFDTGNAQVDLKRDAIRLRTRVCLVIKKRDMTYFTDRIVFQKEMSIFLFLLLCPILFALLSLLVMFNVIHGLWRKFLFFLFKEKDLISPEEFQQRLRERSLIDKMTPEEKAKLFSKKDLPLGL